jgi:4-hydroxy-tetrahydrodipicolinate synthase
VANVIPGLCRAIDVNLREGRLQSVRFLSSRLSPLAELLAADHPAALKYALSLLGLMAPNTRLPIVELDQADQAQVARVLADFNDEGLIKVAKA